MPKSKKSAIEIEQVGEDDLFSVDEETGTEEELSADEIKREREEAQQRVPDFPCAACEAGCQAEIPMGNLVRLLEPDLATGKNKYVNGPALRALVAVLARSYRQSLTSPRWLEDPHLTALGQSGGRFAKILAAVFDLLINIEYIANHTADGKSKSGRVTNDKWIYCDAAQDGIEATAPGTQARLFFSFLKRCPRCVFQEGLDHSYQASEPGQKKTGIPKSQHKLSSHAIGEITGTVMALLLSLVTQSQASPLKIVGVNRQNHDVDLVCYRDDLAILLEVKASPMVTFPLALDRTTKLFKNSENEDGENHAYERHSLVENTAEGGLYFYLPHRDKRYDLGGRLDASWPYPDMQTHMSDPEQFLDYLSAWSELFTAYVVPKTTRGGEHVRLAYLTNGWGDALDSNKTKPGLGRTDDLKKGTYQMLKYGAYYIAPCKRGAIRSALVANLGPLNFRKDYMERLEDVKWGHGRDFSKNEGRPNEFVITADHLFDLYEAVIAFNAPMVNNDTLKSVFDFDRADQALTSGALDTFLTTWTALATP